MKVDLYKHVYNVQNCFFPPHIYIKRIIQCIAFSRHSYPECLIEVKFLFLFSACNSFIYMGIFHEVNQVKCLVQELSVITGAGTHNLWVTKLVTNHRASPPPPLCTLYVLIRSLHSVLCRKCCMIELCTVSYSAQYLH